MVGTRMSVLVHLLLTLILSTAWLDIPAQKECGVRRVGMPPRQTARHWLDNDSVLTVPVVFHMIFSDSTQWISDEAIDRQLQSLNRDFRRLNEDREETPIEFTEVAADCKIEFCLASIDPTRAPTTGIERSTTQIQEIGLTDIYYQPVAGGQEAWDPTLYLNIWACEISAAGDVAGFSSMPGDDAKSGDGVVIDYRFFGDGENGNPSFAAGRTLTHEIGHWLGLEHIWGDEPGCDTDDGIADTPKQFDRYRGCPVFPQWSCGTSDMYMNFMDLTDDLCMNLFTEGQKIRMRNTLYVDRSAILSSDRCNDQITASIDEGFRSITISPNPASHYLEIEISPEKTGDIQILSTDGRVALRTNNVNRINISHLEQGIYFLTVRSSRHRFTFRFIKI